MADSPTDTSNFSWPVRVYFEDTDAGGVVYHARYLAFFERARTELLRALGIHQQELKDKHNLIWVLLDIHVKFRMAAKLDDELEVSAEFTWSKGARYGMHQEMVRKSDGAVVATAELSVVMLHADSHKPARVPAWIKAELKRNGE